MKNFKDSAKKEKEIFKLLSWVCIKRYEDSNRLTFLSVKLLAFDKKWSTLQYITLSLDIIIKDLI